MKNMIESKLFEKWHPVEKFVRTFIHIRWTEWAVISCIDADAMESEPRLSLK